ncbi:unnamed protein product [Onchocerca flexuosa]|uniref:Phage protein n=1 Tax=Onchocerca flexuosa TaxID=387005 RepID=A0A183HUB9_9BILA|nr:unnamed protein product [Onchocerca flexuosa]
MNNMLLLVKYTRTDPDENDSDAEDMVTEIKNIHEMQRNFVM